MISDARLKIFQRPYTGMSLNQIHSAVGIGRQEITAPCALRLKNVEVVYTFENECIFREFEPVSEYFPAQWAPPQVSRDKAGSTVVERTSHQRGRRLSNGPNMSQPK
jgi:hypothetical protein